MSIYSRTEFLDAWKRAMEDKEKKDGIIFLHRKSYDKFKCLAVMDNEELKVQAKVWKKQIKTGILEKPLDGNCITSKVDDKDYHLLVIQHKNKDHCYHDSLGLFILNYMVSGHIYAFESKVNRDRIYNYLSK